MLRVLRVVFGGSVGGRFEPFLLLALLLLVVPSKAGFPFKMLLLLLLLLLLLEMARKTVLTLKTLWRLLRLIMVWRAMLPLKRQPGLVLVLLRVILTDQRIGAFGRFRGTGTVPPQLLVLMLMGLVRELLTLMVLLVVMVVLQLRRGMNGRTVHLIRMLLPGTTLAKQLLLFRLLLPRTLS